MDEKQTKNNNKVNGEDDWYIKERIKNLKDVDTMDEKSAKTRTKDFLQGELNELNAMSKLSLLEDDEKIKMDDTISTRSSVRAKDELLNEIYGLNEKDRFLASKENSPASIGTSVRSSMRFDEPVEEDEFQMESKSETNIHIRLSNFPTIDECDFPQSPYGDNRESINPSVFFDDGIRSIDYVLVWKKLLPPDDYDETDAIKFKEMDEMTRKEAMRNEKREVFQEHLINEGLHLESYVVDDEITFIKIHAPFEVLRRYAEILKLRMPMKEIPGLTTVGERTKSAFKNTIDYFVKKFIIDEKNFPPISHRFTAIYSRDKEYLFDLQQPNFFGTWVRARIVQFILDRQRFSRDTTHDFSFGIERLVSDETYIAAYALHDGELTTKGTRRHLLYTEWASLRKIFHYQPLDYIKNYFGVKIGIYFAWLGFYTYMLILASIAGIISFIFSIKWMNQNPITQQICKTNQTYVMCPLCDKLCDYWNLKETCLQAKITSLFDNQVTVIFAIFMSFWAALFLEHWKRYSAEITHRWDLTGFDVHEEHPRPQYLARLKSIKREKKDFVTNVSEPNVPFWRMKLPATLLSVSVVLLLISCALATVFGVVLYRISVLASLSIYRDLSTSFTILFTTTTAAIMNLILIVILNYAYESLAEWLTELELLRTQTEFDDSLTLKIYLLQFVNYYASIFYIAFFKGKFVGTPKNYNRFFDFRQEECGIGGCLMELFIQLAIIMIGKQSMNACVEMLWPVIMKYFNSLRLRTKKQRVGTIGKDFRRYVNDLKLIEFGSRGLFPEYLEMVLQYGFITIFVVAFPLAPTFALINNIFEMRFDAKKLLAYYRRPIFARVRSIGIWYRILDCISKLSVISNGFIIGFTSDFVPRLVYMLYYSKDGTLDGYVEWTLSSFDVKELKNGTAPLIVAKEFENITECRYQDFRYPQNHPNEYERTAVFWNVMAARLIFVVLFENTVAIVMLLVKWLIPDISAELRDKIRREAYITNEIIIKQEAKMASQHASAKSYIKSGSAWNKLLKNDLTGSQLDLFIQKEEETRTNTRQRKNKTQNFIDNEARGDNSNHISSETNV